MINTQHRWSLPVILGSVVLLLAGTGLFLIVRPAARATATPPAPNPSSKPTATTPSPTPSQGGPQWSDWDDLGGSFNAGPSVASWSANRLDVFTRGAGQIMLHRAYDGTKWHPAEDLGAAIVGSPAAVARWADRLDVFVRGADNQLWQKSWNGGWMGYFPLGGFLTSSPPWLRGRRIGWTFSSGAATTRCTTSHGAGSAGPATSGSAATWRVPHQPSPEGLI